MSFATAAKGRVWLEAAAVVSNFQLDHSWSPPYGQPNFRGSSMPDGVGCSLLHDPVQSRFNHVGQSRTSEVLHIQLGLHALNSLKFT